MIIGIIITYTDTTYKRVNNKVDRIELVRWLHVHRDVFDSPSPATFDETKTMMELLKFQCAMIAVLRYPRLRGC